ncbi:carboxypeptidase, putative, partial [Bodo saltans]
FVMEAYSELVKVFSRLHNLGHLSAICSWDSMVNMPPKSGAARGAALAELDVISHNIITDKRVQTLLKEAQEAATALTETEQSNLREMSRQILNETKLPESIVERKALVSSKAEQAWRQLRPKNDWDGFVPHLKEIVQISREMAGYLAAGTDMNLYEALLNMYEPGMTVGVLDSVFDDVKSWLPQLIQEVKEKNASTTILMPEGPFPIANQKELGLECMRTWKFDFEGFQEVKEKNASTTILMPEGPFPIAKQKELGLECMRTWKFDFEAGRLDISTHPFCGGVPEDVRLTTRYQEDNFDQSLMGIIHETGHGKYEQNRPKELLNQPGSRARSMGVHESQSLFAEMQIGRSAAFAKYLTPLVIKHLGQQPAFTVENMKNLACRVKPGLIRVDADELCYPLHVILRYEIERALVEGTLEVDAIPAVWDAKMKEYLGQDTTGNFLESRYRDRLW